LIFNIFKKMFNFPAYSFQNLIKALWVSVIDEYMVKSKKIIEGIFPTAISYSYYPAAVNHWA
jgi:hypothetical protein